MLNINESSLGRLYDYMQSSDVGFVTAFKSPSWIKSHYKVESGASVPREVHKINRERNNDLLKNIRAKGYSCFKVDGSYENQERKNAGLPNYTDKEESFAVVNTHHNKNFVNDIVELGKKYNQESVLIVKAGGKEASFHYADGTVEDAGKPTLGKDSPFKSLINGRPFVVGEKIESNIKSKKQLNEYTNCGFYFDDDDITESEI